MCDVRDRPIGEQAQCVRALLEQDRAGLACSRYELGPDEGLASHHGFVVQRLVFIRQMGANAPTCVGLAVDWPSTFLVFCTQFMPALDLEGELARYLCGETNGERLVRQFRLWTQFHWPIQADELWVSAAALLDVTAVLSGEVYGAANQAALMQRRYPHLFRSAPAGFGRGLSAAR